jgi:hypothetical protein
VSDGWIVVRKLKRVLVLSLAGQAVRGGRDCCYTSSTLPYLLQGSTNKTLPNEAGEKRPHSEIPSLHYFELQLSRMPKPCACVQPPQTPRIDFAAFTNAHIITVDRSTPHGLIRTFKLPTFFSRSASHVSLFVKKNWERGVRVDQPGAVWMVGWDLNTSLWELLVARVTVLSRQLFGEWRRKRTRECDRDVLCGRGTR